MSVELQKSIKKKILLNNNFLDDINQILHNEGVEQSKRYIIIKNLLLKKFSNDTLSVDIDINSNVLKKIEPILSDIFLSKQELFQKFFMFYGDKFLKKSLDQFYTPANIGSFICSCLVKNKKIIDPAGGTGDLVISYEGKSINVWDKSKEAIDMAKINFEIQNKKASFNVNDSLLDYDTNNEFYDYVILNPPFGTKTITDDKDILENYSLGKNKSKQELGILFIERSLMLLKNKGILFVVVPNGYLGNSNSSYVNLRKMIVEENRLIAIIKLPDNTFSRSGTGVSTSILVIQKCNKIQTENYNIFIENITEIGYELNKKNTPLKFLKDDEGNYIVNDNQEPVINSDLNTVFLKLSKFAKDNNIDNLVQSDNNIKYEQIEKDNLADTYILDINRYLNIYKNTITTLSSGDCCKIRDLTIIKPNISFNRKKAETTTYKYLDISEVNTPLYNGKKLKLNDLPQRAKYILKKHDIIVSKLKGNITFCVITEEENNVVSSNGFCVIRPKDYNSLIIIFANLFTKEFKIQHQSLVTGSIMESLDDNDIYDIIINKEVNYQKYETIINSLTILNKELLSCKE
jgi:type I restriction enzyme M protein